MFLAMVESVMFANGLSAPQHSTYLVILEEGRVLEGMPPGVAERRQTVVSCLSNKLQINCSRGGFPVCYSFEANKRLLSLFLLLLLFFLPTPPGDLWPRPSEFVIDNFLVKSERNAPEERRLSANPINPCTDNLRRS